MNDRDECERFYDDVLPPERQPKSSNMLSDKTTARVARMFFDNLDISYMYKLNRAIRAAVQDVPHYHDIILEEMYERLDPKYHHLVQPWFYDVDLAQVAPPPTYAPLTLDQLHRIDDIFEDEYIDVQTYVEKAILTAHFNQWYENKLRRPRDFGTDNHDIQCTWIQDKDPSRSEEYYEVNPWDLAIEAVLRAGLDPATVEAARDYYIEEIDTRTDNEATNNGY